MNSQTLEIQVSQSVPAPKFKRGDRVADITCGDPLDELGVYVGLITDVRLSRADGWIYKVDPRGDKLSERFSHYSWGNCEPWIEEFYLQPFDHNALEKINAPLVRKIAKLQAELASNLNDFDAMIQPNPSFVEVA